MSKIKATQAILSDNDRQAQANRLRLDALNLTGVNVLASPGAGKTSVIVAALQGLDGLSRGVIEGDVASSIDTDRIRGLGFPAVQINTAGGCHLTADMVHQAMDELNLRGPGILFIENIGNLICPASFDLGEHVRLVIASVAEGDDKPTKYPQVFALADAVVLNKTDLTAMTEFNLDLFRARLRAVNPHAPLLEISCRTGENLPLLRQWLLDQTKLPRH